MQKWIKIIFLINALGQSLALAVWQHLGCAGLGWLGWAGLLEESPGLGWVRALGSTRQ